MESLPASPAVQCVECGSELPANAKFCLECGTAVLTDDAEPESRRTVTLLFTDVTGSTAMGEQLDPETYRRVMGRYFAVARAAVERHGGRLEKFVGDAVLAVFGLPEVREDDALRAVRAAFELNQAVAELSDRLAGELGVHLQIRTGVNTGAVVTGSPRAGGSFATGDAVNTAARLEQAAGPGHVLIGATTHDLVRDAVVTEPVDPVVAKGKTDPVAAYRLLRVLDAERGRRTREHAQMVGRERETRALDDALDRTLATGRSHLVTVIGPAGMGKTRLISEFLTRVGDRAAVASGRCVSYGQGITYWPLVQAVRDVLTLSGTESDELTRHALEQAVGETADRDAVVDLLMPLVGRSGEPGGADRTYLAFRRLLERLAARRPLVLRIDDLHWAEPALIELLERLREDVDDLPLLLVCQARPDLLEQHPTWASGALNAVTFALDPLQVEHVERSVSAILEAPPPAGLAQTVADWSGGNPLFVEEIVAHLLESGALVQGRDGQWSMSGHLHDIDLPPTVSALLMSRLERLPSSERRLLDSLSVIGLEFTHDDALLLYDAPDLSSLLTSLARRDLLRRVRSLEGDSWAFKHLMVRDAAYDGMSKAVRARLHERFADGLLGTDIAERESFAAHHLARAAAYDRELGSSDPRTEQLVERAVAALMAQAQAALDRDEFEAAIALLEQAAQLSVRSPERRREVLVQLVTSLHRSNRAAMLAPYLDRLAETLTHWPDPLDQALHDALRLDQQISVSDEVDPALARTSAQHLVALAQERGATTHLVSGLIVLASTAIMEGHWVDAVERTRDIARLGGPNDRRRAAAMVITSSLYGPASVAEAARQAREAAGFVSPEREAVRAAVIEAIFAAATQGADSLDKMRLAVELVDESRAKGIRPPQFLLIDVHSLMRDLDLAIDRAVRVNADFRETGETSFASTYILFEAALRLERGDDLEAIGALVEEAASYTSPYDVLSLAYLAGCRAVLASRTGDPRALELADRSLEIMDTTDQLWQNADLRRLVSEVWETSGDSERARTVLNEARDLYRGKGITAYDDEVRARLARL